MELLVDTSNANLGDVITQAKCEEIIGFTEKSDFKGWQLAMLQLLGVVQKQLRAQHRRDITVRIVGNEIHILTDSEAATYNPKRFEAGLRMARRSHRRLLAVNTSKLTPQQREQHMKTIGNQAHKLSMLRRREEIPLPASERKTPVMAFANRK